MTYYDRLVAEDDEPVKPKKDATPIIQQVHKKCGGTLVVAEYKKALTILCMTCRENWIPASGMIPVPKDFGPPAKNMQMIIPGLEKLNQ